MGRLTRAVALVAGTLAILQYFVPHGVARWVEGRLADWLVLLETAALVGGVGALVLFHWRRARRGGSAGAYSWLVLGALGFSVVTGLVPPLEPVFRALFSWLLSPIQATMMSLVAFSMAWAAFRSFHTVSGPATIFVVSALTVMVSRVPLGEQLFPHIGVFATWIIRVPNVAATRGLLIGVGLASVATALRVIVGIQGPTRR